MTYRIDITNKKDSFLPTIKAYNKEDKPKGLDPIATFFGAEGGYILGDILTNRFFEDATTRAMQNKANSLYESAGRRVEGILHDLGNGNRALKGMPPAQQEKVSKVIGSPFIEKLVGKIKEIKETSPLFSYSNAARNFAQASAEARVGRLIESGMKKHTTPMGRFGKRVGLAVTGGILAHLIVKKLYDD